MNDHAGDAVIGTRPDQAVRPARRGIAMTVWALLFAAVAIPVGLPTDPVYVFAWLWAAAIAWDSHLPWRAHLRFGRDWWPAVVLLVGYTVSRGYAGRGTPHVLEMLAADVRMWGWATGGVAPTVWLQRHLYDPGAPHWWDLAVSCVYFSHFALTPTIAVVLWLRRREQWARFMRRWIALSAAGLATYFQYPAAPPWWADRYGMIHPAARLSTRGWDAIGLHGAGNLLGAAQLAVSNQVAAMPSLHAGFALLAVAFFAPRVRRRWWPLLAAYPLAMAFTLVYGGEHWVIDVLVGWLYVAMILVAVAACERWAAATWRPGERPRLAAVLGRPATAAASAGIAGVSSTAPRPQRGERPGADRTGVAR